MAEILVVDDEIGIRELLSEILGDEGHEVLSAENARQARELRDENRLDLVLLDIWMPDTDGITLLKEWASSGKLTMPVIMMSGHATIDTAVEATRIGAIDFLEKPITMQKLLTAVETGLQRGRNAQAQPQRATPSFAPSADAYVPARPLGDLPVLPPSAPPVAGLTAGAALTAGGPLTAGRGLAAGEGLAAGANPGAGVALPAVSLGAPADGRDQNGLLAADLDDGGTGLRVAPEPAAGLSASLALRELPLDAPLREARDAFERAYFEHHLAREQGSMTRVAERTGLERTHLYRKLKQLGIDLSRGAWRKPGASERGETGPGAAPTGNPGLKIIILGAGRVGASVAENLVSERNDITVVDTDVRQLGLLQDKFDLRTVAGNGTHPPVLEQAGIEDADMLIAAATHDETNLVACQLAARLYNVPTRIARIRAPEFQTHPEITGEGGFYVDHLICPEQTVTDYVRKLIEFPEALQVLEFAGGRASLIAVRAYAGGPLVSHPIRDLRAHHPKVDMRVVAMFRNERSIVPDGDTTIEPGDEVFLLAPSEHIRTALSDLRRIDKPVRRVMIAGGGNIGLRVARSLGSDYQVKVIESNRTRCNYLVTQLPAATLVLNGDSTDEGLLSDEGVGEMDLFLAVTSDDENNIMSCMLAKRMGARRTIALINRQAYAELVEGHRIDIAIVPSLTTIGQLLAHVRRGDVVAVHSLRRGAAEALEAVAHGDPKSSKVVGRRIDEIDLPRGATIGAVVRPVGGGELSVWRNEREPPPSQVLIAHHDTVVESGDHVIVFVENRRIVSKVEKLFQVGVGFF